MLNDLKLIFSTDVRVLAKACRQTANDHDIHWHYWLVEEMGEIMEAIALNIHYIKRYG
jgi:NTP pyrophosphatase (non-canonical NTP hydrolase)